MGNIASNRPIFSAALNIYIINCVLNVLASILTLVLIWFMRRNGTLRLNLFTVCVLLMTIYQLLFDLSLTLTGPCGPSTANYTCSAVFVGGFMGAGIGNSSFALMGTLVTLFMVEFGRKPTIREGYVAFTLIHVFIFAWTVPIAYGLYESRNNLEFYTTHLTNYNYCRIVLIIVIFIAILRLYYRMRQVTAGKDKTRSPLYHLTWRLIWYPVIQVVSRLGVAPYNFAYGESIDNFPESAGPTQRFLLFLNVLLTPLAGIGAFLVFLYTQRGAIQELKRLLLCHCTIQAQPLNKELSTQKSTLKNKSRTTSHDNPQPIVSDSFAVERASDMSVTQPSFDTRSFASDYVYNGSFSSTRGTELELNLDESRLTVMDESELMHQYIAENDALATEQRNRLNSGQQTSESSAKGVALKALGFQDSIPLNKSVINPINKNYEL